MDELKKYLQNHADKLNVDQPRPQVWANIERETSAPKKPATLIVFTRWAAAACILVLAGIGTWHIFNNKPDQPQLQAKTENKATQPAPAQKEANAEIAELTTIAKTNEPNNKTKGQKLKAKSQSPVNSKEAIEALTNIENSFTQVINLQRARVSTTPMYAETPEYFNDFKIQIKQIEKDEKAIKSDIAKRGMTDELLDQLINVYEQKLNTLKQLQIEMNKTNNRFKQNRGPVDSTRTYFLNI
jgi:hypothetical protein